MIIKFEKQRERTICSVNIFKDQVDKVDAISHQNGVNRSEIFRDLMDFALMFFDEKGNAYSQEKANEIFQKLLDSYDDYK